MWNISVPEMDGVTSRELIITSISQFTSLLVKKKSFKILIISLIEETPLISMMSVANLTADMNGTVINCTDVGDSLAETSTSVTKINILKTSNG